MENFASVALLILAPIAAIAFAIEYGWSDWIERNKPKTGSQGQPLGTTPVGYPRDQSRIDIEAPIIAKFNEDMKAFRIHLQRFEKVKPFLKRVRFYSSILTFLFGCLKLALLKFKN